MTLMISSAKTNGRLFRLSTMLLLAIWDGAYRSTSGPRLARRRLRCARTVWPLIVTRAPCVRCGDGDVDHSLGSGGGTGTGSRPSGSMSGTQIVSVERRIDDVIVGRGLIFSSGGQAEWRFLNRMEAGAREVSPFSATSTAMAARTSSPARRQHRCLMGRRLAFADHQRLRLEAFRYGRR